jgi:hypothetical protein
MCEERNQILISSCCHHPPWQLLNNFTRFNFRHPQTMDALQIEPEQRTQPKLVPKTQSSIARNAALALDDLRDAVSRNFDLAHQFGCRDAEFQKFVA